MGQTKLIIWIQMIGIPVVSMLLAYLLATDSSMAEQGRPLSIFGGYALQLYTALAAGCFWARKPRLYRVSLGFCIPVLILGPGNALITKIIQPAFFLWDKDLLWGIVVVALIPVPILFTRYLLKQVSEPAA